MSGARLFCPWTFVLVAAFATGMHRPETEADPARPGIKAEALREQLERRVEEALRQGASERLNFEAVELSHWRLRSQGAEFVLWGLLERGDAAAEMLRIEGRLDRRSLRVQGLQLQRFDELQALGPALDP